jgi:hypothetical protein
MNYFGLKVIQVFTILLLVAAITTTNQLIKDNKTKFKKGRPLFSPKRVDDMLHGIMNIMIVTIIILIVSIVK